MRKVLAAFVAAGLLAAVSLAAQAPGTAAKTTAEKKWTPARTADGHPDLQGVWANNSVTPLERPKEWAGKDSLTGAELEQLKRDISSVLDKGGDAIFGGLVDAALANKKLTSYDPTTGNYNHFWLADRDIDNRTSLITDPADGRLPTLTAEGQRRRAARAAGGRAAEPREDGPAGKADGPEDRSTFERCITPGAPRTGAGYNSYFQIVQARDHVAIVQELIHDARIVPLDGRPHLPQNVRQWHGDPRGHWEGDTLVVETTNFSAKAPRLNGASENVVLTERYTRVSPDYINWEITVNDPVVWTRPWTEMIRLKHVDKQMYEYACHEGNISLPGILAGFRAQEKAAEAAKKGSN